MKTTKKHKRKSNLQRRGLINRMRIEFEISSKTLDSLLEIIENEHRSLDDLIKEGLENFANGFIKPVGGNRK